MKQLIKLEIEKIELANFLPEEFHDNFREYAFIAGGAVYCYLNGTKAQDYDFFLKNKDFADSIYNYFKNLKYEHERKCIKEQIPVDSLLYNNRRVIITPNAITFQAPKYSGECDWQIITKFVGEPMDVISQFDFKHNMLFWDDNTHTENDEHIVCYYEYDNGSFSYKVPDKLYYERQLLFNEDRARDICGVLLRLPKFLRRDFTISKEEHSKIIRKALNIVEHRLDVEAEDIGSASYSGEDNINYIKYVREVEILDSYLEY